MEPFAALQSLLNVNRNGAVLIGSGLAVFAAAAIVSGWITDDFSTALIIAVAVVVGGVLLTCPSSAPMRQIQRIEEGRISGSS
jgi:uncharacterized membrane protein YadS